MDVARFHGRDLAYDARGSMTGLPLLLVHGIGSTGAAWEPVVARLSAVGVPTITVDLPGHGNSSKETGDYSLGALASLLRDLLDFLDVPAAVLVGHSLGGGIVLQFSYQYPERVAGAALICSGGLGTETSAVLRLSARPGAGVVMAAVGSRATVNTLSGLGRLNSRLRQPPRAIFHPSTLDRLREFGDPEHRQASRPWSGCRCCSTCRS